MNKKLESHQSSSEFAALTIHMQKSLNSLFLGEPINTKPIITYPYLPEIAEYICSSFSFRLGDTENMYS